MTDKDLISQLNSLKNISPDQNWLKSNRELLLSQISNSGATELSVWKVFVINFQSFSKAASQPAFALAAFVLILLSGSLFGHQLFNQAKPNDSLYIARIISEKARLTTVLNSEARGKMEAQFAADHAQDIANTLADTNFNNDSNQDQVAKLNESFGREIATVKTRINHLNETSKLEASKLSSVSQIPTPVTEPAVLIANTLKDNQGVQVFENPTASITTPVLDFKKATLTPSLDIDNVTATLSADIISQDSVFVDADKILDEAKKLFDEKDYDKAIDKLKEVDEIIK